LCQRPKKWYAFYERTGEGKQLFSTENRAFMQKRTGDEVLTAETAAKGGRPLEEQRGKP